MRETRSESESIIRRRRSIAYFLVPVSNQPVFHVTGFIHTPPYNTNNVIGHHGENARIVDNLIVVIQNGLCVNGRRHRTTSVDFGLDFGNDARKAARVITVGPVLGNRGVGKGRHGFTMAIVATGPARIDIGTSGIDVGAETVRRVAAARHVGHTIVVGNHTGM